jgi:hypothetical protein
MNCEDGVQGVSGLPGILQCSDIHASLGKLQERYIHVDTSVGRNTASRTAKVSAENPDDDTAYVSNDGAGGRLV